MNPSLPSPGRSADRRAYLPHDRDTAIQATHGELMQGTCHSLATFVVKRLARDEQNSEITIVSFQLSFSVSRVCLTIRQCQQHAFMCMIISMQKTTALNQHA